MRTRCFVLAFLLFACSGVSCKADVGDDGIFISVIQPDSDGLPQDAAEQLSNKMERLITMYGIVDTDPNSRFVITAKCDVVSKDIVGGAPQRISQKLDISFMVGDAIENKVFETCTLTATGIGTSESKAYINAINKVNVNNPLFETFIEKAKEKILQYYSIRCDQIVNQAKQQAANRDYSRALYLLMQVPTLCDCAETCQELMLEYYYAYNEATAAKLLNQAKAKWASSPNADGASDVANIIKGIPANTSVQPELNKLISEINEKLRDDEKRDWKFKMQQYNDDIARQKREDKLREQQQAADNAYRSRQQEYDAMERRQVIEACRQIGLTFAKNISVSSSRTRIVHSW